MAVEPIAVDKIAEVKAASVKIIQTFRGLSALGVNDLTIGAIRDLGEEYFVQGEYRMTMPFGGVLEKGKYEFKLTKKELKVSASSITPDTRPSSY
jgi:hypothetical protein